MFSLSDLSLVEEIVDADDGTAKVGGDNGTTTRLHQAHSTNLPQMLLHHLQVTVQHVISLLTSHTLSLWNTIERSIISLFMQMEWRYSSMLRPPHALSPTTYPRVSSKLLGHSDMLNQV